MTFAILVRESCTCKFKPAASRPMYSASTTLWLRHSELGHGVGQRRNVRSYQAAQAGLAREAVR